MSDFLFFVGNRDKFALGLFKQFRIEETPSRVLIITPTLYYKKWVLEYIKSRLSDYGKEILVKAQEEREERKTEEFKDGLLAKYTFENFIVGPSNELAYRLCMEVSSNPGLYNPLFIYGSVGLGKSHLIHALGNRAKATGYRVVYSSANHFSEEMVKSLREGKIEAFRSKYSAVDILLLDDVQFLSGKERTQLELFRIFEDLQAKEKQIVLVSDRHPKDIQDVHERLVSRFASGIVIEIGLDMETKLLIVKHKLESFGLPADEEHISHVMENTGYSVREIEGFIKTLRLTGIRKGERTEQKTERLLMYVARNFNLKVEDLKKDTKERRVINARYIAIYFCKVLLGMSYSEIARLFGKPDHTHALYAVRKVEEKKSKDKKFFMMLEAMQSSLKKILQ